MTKGSSRTHSTALMPFCEARSALWARYSAAIGQVVESVAKVQSSQPGRDLIALARALEAAIAANESALEWRKMAEDHEREHHCGPLRG